MPPPRRAAKTPQRQPGRAPDTDARAERTEGPRRAAPTRARQPATSDAQKPATTNALKSAAADTRKPTTTDARKASSTNTRKAPPTGARKASATKARKAPAAGAREPRATKARRTETTVVVVGAGRLGSALARALDAAGGYRVTALVSRRLARARRAARALRPGALALSAAELDRVPASDLLIIATPDGQIGPTADRLAAALPPPPSPARAARPVALHASGALSSDALARLRERGYSVGSLHPLVSVADADAAAASWRGAFFCVEGEAAAARAARRIVRTLGGHAFSVRAADKALYHAAAVLASGHAVALFDLAVRTLTACRLSPRAARRALLPLARSTVANLSAAPATHAALTGPFARADAETVRRHLAAFDARGLSAARLVYARLGLRSLALAAESGADASALDDIARALAADGEDGGRL